MISSQGIYTVGRYTGSKGYFQIIFELLQELKNQLENRDQKHWKFGNILCLIMGGYQLIDQDI